MSKYIPKHIKNGIKINQAREIIAGYKGANITLSVHTFDRSRDVYGNQTAHYSAILFAETGGKVFAIATIVSNGKRREQTGYASDNVAASYALQALGYKLELLPDSEKDQRYGAQEYTITNL